MADADSDAEVEEGAGEGPEGPAEDQAISDLVARIAAYDEELATEVESLERRIESLEADLEDRVDEIEDLRDRLQRERADFQNYKKRAQEREEQLRERATEDLVERLLDVRDNLVRALSQEGDVGVRDGVEATLATFDRILDDENVTAIEPDPGDSVDPTVHEVVMRVDGEHPAGTIEEVYRPGYKMAGRVLRPAQVTVNEGDDAAADAYGDGDVQAASDDAGPDDDADDG